MEFAIRRFMGITAAVLLWAGLAVAETGEANITVLVTDSARVPPLILEQAEVETERIFRAARVEIAWVNCSSGAETQRACNRVLDSDEYVVHIERTGRANRDSVFGIAFLGSDGRGKYGDVFFGRIEELHNSVGMSTARLLGAVMAHELGHLLLGSHAHSPIGIMMPTWEDQSLRRIGMGTFLFTSEQASVMKARLGREDTGLIRAGIGAGN
jgi:hypothetical protein